MFRILLVEDDPEISGVLERQLTAWNYQVGLIRDFRDVLGDFRTFQPHLVLLDIGLPYRNGYHWCEEIRKISKVPILFLSSASDNLNIIMAVNLGGDDFLAKPFDLNVLLAKVQALLRRAYDFGAPDFTQLFPSVPLHFLSKGDTIPVYHAGQPAGMGKGFLYGKETGEIRLGGRSAGVPLELCGGRPGLCGVGAGAHPLA